MIFASDLDQTLIYSKKRIEEIDEKNRVIIEYLDGSPLSYMSRKSQTLLREISRLVTFIPITTRTVEQYKRIDLGINGEVPYAVTSNGGRVFISGMEDLQWQSHIQNQLEDKCLGINSISTRFRDVFPGDWVKSVRNAEGFFIYCIVDESSIPIDELRNFEPWLNDNNWSLSIQGRKIYFIPSLLQKSEALKYISEMSGKKILTGAGDSLLDLSFLKEAKYPFVPRHGELFNSSYDLINSLSMTITSSSGISASEELLTSVLKICRSVM